MAGTPATVAAFLADNAAESFCSQCIAFGLTLSSQEVRGALAALAKEIVVNTEAGICSACSGRMPTYGLGSIEGASPDEIISRALGRTPGPGVCRTCLGKQLSLTLHEVQRACWRLRAAGQAVLATDRCSVCERPRMLMRFPEAAG